MLNHSDIMSTVDMIDHQHLDIRTITMGISLLDCADPDITVCARKVHVLFSRLKSSTRPCLWRSSGM